MEDSCVMIIGESSDEDLWDPEDIIEYVFDDGEILRVFG